MHRIINQIGINLIKQFEGFRSAVYICSGGHPTIGFGHKLLPHEKYLTISISYAEKLLVKDLIKAEKSVMNCITSHLTDNQFAALVSFTFNVGGAALQRSSLRQKINYGNFIECNDEFPKWIYAGGRRIPGLIKRRNAERDLFFDGLNY